MNIKELKNELEQLIQRPRFVGVTYTAKKNNETSRFTLLVGASYYGLVQESINEVVTMLKNARGIRKVVLKGLLESFQESLAAYAQNRPHVNDTKPDQYTYITNRAGLTIPGIRINLNDGTAELAGRVHSKVVLIPGEEKIVKHKSVETALRAEFRRQLPVSKFVTLAVDSGHLESVRINGETLEFD